MFKNKKESQDKDKNKKSEVNQEESQLQENKAVDPLEDKIKELEDALERERNSKLLVMAEFQNFKKRQENEKNDYRIFATKMIISQLMQITDDYVRIEKDIKERLKNNQSVEDFVKSIRMLDEKIKFIITQNGYEEIDIKENDKFNPETMEALTTVPVSEKEKDGVVILIDQKGYKHIESGVIFKTAKVIIGKYNETSK